jgi:hypothetical protein
MKVGGIAVTSTSVFRDVMKNQIKGSRLKKTIISVTRKNRIFCAVLLSTASLRLEDQYLSWISLEPMALI